MRKIARLFRALEEQSGFLWNEVTRGQVHTLIEQVMEDLNNYCECMIPINESNTINLKLFPIFPPPPPVKAYHVPICTVRLQDLIDANWDLTMQKVGHYHFFLFFCGDSHSCSDTSLALITYIDYPLHQRYRLSSSDIGMRRRRPKFNEEMHLGAPLLRLHNPRRYIPLL